ncbi:MAG: glycogen debranching protein, partial [Chloroflexi bacterium]|nr:glycogen debranching protein [Chloroflexota bacterium]
GFASGTIAGMLTRRYHGLLMAALQPPLGRTLLFAKLDETVTYGGMGAENGRSCPLYVNRWMNNVVEPNGHHFINRFHLEGTTPVWTFAIANALLEKRIWMQQGANTTYIQYKLTRASEPLTLKAKAFVNYRDYHSTTIMNDWQPKIQEVSDGLSLQIYDGATPFYLLSDKMKMTVQFEWFQDFHLSVETYRDKNDVQEDHICAAHLRAILHPGESLTLVASTEPEPILDGAAAYAERLAHEESLLSLASEAHAVKLPQAVKQLVLAADQFIVKRSVQRSTAQD